MFIDEIMELFGGANGDYLINNLSYKELVARRDARIKRKNKEFEEEQKIRKEEIIPFCHLLFIMCVLKNYICLHVLIHLS